MDSHMDLNFPSRAIPLLNRIWSSGEVAVKYPKLHLQFGFEFDFFSEVNIATFWYIGTSPVSSSFLIEYLNRSECSDLMPLGDYAKLAPFVEGKYVISSSQFSIPKPQHVLFLQHALSTTLSKHHTLSTPLTFVTKVNMVSFISTFVAALAACATLAQASAIRPAVPENRVSTDVRGIKWSGTLSNGTTVHLAGTLTVSLSLFHFCITS